MFSRVFQTIRHLTPQQFVGQVGVRCWGRVRYRRGPRPAAFSIGSLRASPLPCAPHIHADKDLNLTLLSITRPLGQPIDWQPSGVEPLWTYQLHYHEWVRHRVFEPGQRLEILLDWVERHRRGVGWEPGPISIRVFAWAKLLRAAGALPSDSSSQGLLATSFADQLATLRASVERHLSGNHLLWNRLALCAGEYLLEVADRTSNSGDALVRELRKQILVDGGHYERSPMYHSLLLENLLDLIQLIGNNDLGKELSAIASKMFEPIALWTHPDGEIALFGDSALGIAPSIASLRSYAAHLEIAVGGNQEAGWLPASRFARFRAGEVTALVTASGPSPAHQPGHAHGDALAFELSVGTHRIVTDSGVFNYVRGSARDQARSTKSHATAMMSDVEQADFWAAHRVGGRPLVEIEDVVPGRRLRATCRPWKRTVGVHRRTFAVEESTFSVTDSFSGCRGSVVVRLPLAPGLEPILRAGGLVIPIGRSEVIVEIDGPVGVTFAEAPYFPTFGVATSRTVVEVVLPVSETLSHALLHVRLTVSRSEQRGLEKTEHLFGELFSIEALASKESAMFCNVIPQFFVFAKLPDRLRDRFGVLWIGGYTDLVAIDELATFPSSRQDDGYAASDNFE